MKTGRLVVLNCGFGAHVGYSHDTSFGFIGLLSACAVIEVLHK
jgi:hypothetical protein